MIKPYRTIQTEAYISNFYVFKDLGINCIKRSISDYWDLYFFKKSKNKIWFPVIDGSSDPIYDVTEEEMFENLLQIQEEY